MSVHPSIFLLAGLGAGLLACDPSAAVPSPGVPGSDAGRTDTIARWATEQTCQQACVAARPDRSRSMPSDESAWCDNVSVAECQTSCAEHVRDTDEACGRCLVAAMTWDDADGGCGSWECYCAGGVPELPSTRHPVCAEACVSTLERQAAQRLAVPVPPATGHLPSVGRELTELGGLRDVALSADGVWVSGITRDGVGHVARLDAELAVLALHDEPEALAGAATSALVAAPDGAVTALFANDSAAMLARLDAKGSLSSRGALPQAEGQAAFYALESAAGDRVLAPRRDLSLTLIDALVGGATGSARAPELVSFEPDVHFPRAFALLGDDRVVLAGSDRSGPSLLILRLTGSPSAPLLEQAAIVPVLTAAPEREYGEVLALVADEAGFITVGGSVHASKQTARLNTTYSGPFVARYDPSGALLWHWEYDADSLVPGQVRALALDAEGNTYSIGTEDPASHEDSPTLQACTVYGCDALAVHKLSADGRLLWSYQHRSAKSSGAAIAVDARNQVWAVGGIAREQVSGVVLRFAPE
jgi:hypothetical protein